MLAPSFVTLTLVALVGLSGCITRIPPREGAPVDGPATSTDAVAALEARLEAAPSVRMKFSVASRGVVVASFQGSLLLQRGNRVRLDASGTLDQKPSNPGLVSDGKQMQGGSLDKTFASASAPMLGDAVLLGLTRMGILHNLIVLSNGAPPEGADGSMPTFATVGRVTRGPNEALNGVDAERYDFKVIIHGKPAGEASLWIDPRTGLPMKRHQVVHFPDGEVDVDETYEAFGLGAPVEPSAFDVAPAAVEI